MVVSLYDNQITRYRSHILLKQIGAPGQKKMLTAKILVIGLGGLGAFIAPGLAASGIGHIGIIDDDDIELSNIHRQILYNTGDIGSSKSLIMAEKIASINPDTNVQVYKEKVTHANARSFIEPYDIVIDGTDNFVARHIINEACVTMMKPLLTASVSCWDGYLAVFHTCTPNSPCYACIFSKSMNIPATDCSFDGIAGGLAGIIGSATVLETIKLVAMKAALDNDYMLMYNSLDNIFQKILLCANPECQVCKI